MVHQGKRHSGTHNVHGRESFQITEGKLLLLLLGISSVAVTDGYVMWCRNGKSLMKAILIIITGYVQYMLLLQCCCQ